MRDEAVDAYIRSQDPERAQRLEAIRTIVHELVPEVVETISYMMPTFKLPGKNGKIIAHMAAFKAHIGLYPIPETIEALAEDLKGYKTSKGAIQLPMENPLSSELVRKVIRTRLAMLQASMPK